MDKKFFNVFSSIREDIYNSYYYYDDSKYTSEPFSDKVSPDEMSHKIEVVISKVLNCLTDFGISHYRQYRSCSNERHYDILGEHNTFLIIRGNKIPALVKDNKLIFNEDGEFFNGDRSGFCICCSSFQKNVSLREYLVSKDPALKKLESNISALLFNLIEAQLKCQPRKTRSAVREHLIWAILCCNDILLGEDMEEYIDRVRADQLID
jgi:hypothetical protein